VGYQTNSPSTGGYWSVFVSFTKPVQTPLQENFIFYSTTRYLEKIVNLTPGNYIDYNVTFQNAGVKIIQTFGPKDAYLYLYNSSGVLLSSNDDAGYSLNALINYNTTANTTYIIRVKYYSASQAGAIKLGITPSTGITANGVPLTTFESIWGPFSLSGTYTVSVQNETQLLRYKVDSTGTYTFYTDRYSSTHDYYDMYLYVVDPTSTEPCLYNDDSGGNLQAKITMSLQGGQEYLVITSRYSITGASVPYSFGLRSGT
jgi:hypothetical protein